MQMKMKLLLSRRRPSESGTARDASRSITQDAAVCGLFAALIAVGAFMKIVIPVGADTMNFTLQWLFVLLAGLLLGSRRAFRSQSRCHADNVAGADGSCQGSTGGPERRNRYFTHRSFPPVRQFPDLKSTGFHGKEQSCPQKQKHRPWPPDDFV